MDSKVESDTTPIFPLKPLLDIDLVREAILEFLSLRDLLTCSLVSKQWRDWCRTFIWKSRVCCVQIPYTHPCSTLLQEFGDFVGKAISAAGSNGSSCHQLPFNGLRITFDSLRCEHYRRHGSYISWDKFLEHTRPLICHLQLKYIFISNAASSILCVGAKLVWKLILHYAAILEEVNFSNLLSLFPVSEIEGLRQMQQGFFPRLRILEFENWPGMDLQKLEELTPVLEALPEHTEIYSYDVDPISVTFIPRNKWHSIRRFALRSAAVKHVTYRELEFNLNALSTLRIHSLKLVSPGFRQDDPDIDLLWRSLHQILTNSWDTLQDFQIEMDILLDFMNLPHYPFPPPKKLRKLTIKNFWVCTDDPEDMAFSPSRNLWGLNWNNFPALYRVELWTYLDLFLDDQKIAREIREFLQSTSYTCRQPCLSVRQLFLRDLEDNVLKLLGPIFPNVKTLEVYNQGDFEQVWTTWPHLEELILLEDVHGKLHLCGDEREREAGYADYRFCGITQEEARLLRSRESDMLQNLHIVRIGPSITDLKQLQSIMFKLWFRPDSDKELIQYLPWFITRLTGLLAFNRMRHLRVTFVLDPKDSTPREEALLKLPCVEVKEGKYE